ncbi:D-glycero-beta-D-manno-heptose 1-phosphate adenylyltransferase [Paenarthrobacter sp. DKR-5]|uniref:D-glycero-beta-D-manno-heptose 1-phosphate adenylyltransferase n=1 Tax=Paenarthrobacter sp. DKR-5 TaxID=2835535 RepID=UPI001BDC1AB1|nr:D-glycero-beta-D-manno-heptose 1-phosphate adenylyltransferase [Paenarthrobacter sp. DKR-5]MBT1001513.1 D-glycero-beta-D-manno-heptose 1-phosphate adenylyltransferase [Paenarthrobacter sp. DKR-5]
MKQPTIVVVGDVLLDVDLGGEATRLCPDAPVPVVDVSSVQRRAGGAGLVAAMLAADDVDVRLVTVLSDDENSELLREALAGIPLTAGPSGAPTPVKTRVRAHGQPVVRFDEGCAPAPLPRVTDEMLAALAAADAVIVADYGRGLPANPELRSALESLTARVPVVWDPHPAGAEPVAGVRVATPNQAEAGRAAGAGTAGPDDAAVAAAALLSRWGSLSVAVTLGADGVLLLDEGGAAPRLLPAPKVPAGDTCGAGDRFAATLALGLAAGAGLDAAAGGAVEAAAAYLAAGGVSALRPPDALPGPQPAALTSDRVDARRLVRQVRQTGGSVIATGGCFDLLHAGHVRTLAAARKLGDCLIVCLNSDSSVRRLKGPQRPIIAEHDRVELLEALECVDAVVLFDEDTPEAVLESLQPDVWVKGGDYSPEDLPEAALMKSWGGRTVTVPYHPARSTTGLASALARVG